MPQKPEIDTGYLGQEKNNDFCPVQGFYISTGLIQSDLIFVVL